MNQEQKKPSRLSRGLRAVGRTALEAIAGGIAGWYFTDSFIHTSRNIDEFDFFDFAFDFKQLDYDATGALIGAVGVPIVSRITQAVYRRYKERKSYKKD